MGILAFNLEWMPWNILLALIGVLFGFLMVRNKNIVVRAFCAFIWLLFMPNTIYILTDLWHLPEQLPKIASNLILPLILQYIILEIAGIGTFIIGLYFFERLIRDKKYRLQEAQVTFLLLAVNFVIGFGVVVGRVQRTNSWEVFTNIGRVFQDAYNVLISPTLIIFTIAIAVIGNVLYFLFRDPVVGIFKGKKKKK